MKILLVYLFFLISINLSAQTGGVYFVPVDGDDNNPGTYTQPWATWNKAFATADAGDTVYFRGGVYYSMKLSMYILLMDMGIVELLQIRFCMRVILPI